MSGAYIVPYLLDFLHVSPSSHQESTGFYNGTQSENNLIQYDQFLDYNSLINIDSHHLIRQLNNGLLSFQDRATEFSSNDDNQDLMQHHYELYMEGHFFEYGLYQSTDPPPIIAANRFGVVYGDPIFESNGGRFEVRGEAHKIYNLLSDRDIQINAMFVPSGTVETNLGSFGIQIRNHRLEYREGGTVFLNGIRLLAGAEATLENGETITWNGCALTIRTAEYNIRITPNRIEVRTSELGVFQDHIMPHGLLGQTIDLDGVPRNGRGIQGEGAIEGTYRNYEVQDLFSNNFIYNRNAYGSGRMPANNNQVVIRYDHRILLESTINGFNNLESSTPIQRFLDSIEKFYRESLGNIIKRQYRTFSLLNDRDVQIDVRVEPSRNGKKNVNYSIRIRNNIIEYRIGGAPLINGRSVMNMRAILGVEEIVRWDGSILTVETIRYAIQIMPDRIEIAIINGQQVGTLPTLVVSR